MDIVDTVNTVSTENVMYAKDWVTLCIPAVITIIGFIATYFSLNKSVKNEIRKQKESIHIEKMSIIPYDVLVLMDDMIGSGKIKSTQQQKKEMDKNAEKFQVIMNTLYSYGSEKAIQLVSIMQKENYAVNADKGKLDQYRVMSLYVLLATQIKYDVTGIAVSPELWFRMRLTDFEDNRQDFVIANNKIVNELGLNNDFKIK